MCMVGDPAEFEVTDTLEVKEYICNDCENKFKGLGKRIVCPACKSENVRRPKK